MGKLRVKCPYCGDNIPVDFSYKDFGVLKTTYCSYSYTFGARGCGKQRLKKDMQKIRGGAGE